MFCNITKYPFYIIMYSSDFRKLAIKLCKSDGIHSTCQRLGIHRTTIWRWKQNIQMKNRKKYMLPLLDKYKGIICDFLDTNPCTSQNILRKLGNIAVSKIQSVNISNCFIILGKGHRKEEYVKTMHYLN